MQSQAAQLHRAASDAQAQRAPQRVESQNVLISRGGAVGRSSLRNQHSSAQISSKTCRCEVLGSDFSSADDAEPQTEGFLTRLALESSEPLGDRLLSAAQDVATQLKSGASPQGTAFGKKKREETGYSSDPRVALLQRVRQFENIQLNSKECICSIIDSEIQQMYELTKQKNTELRTQMLELTDKIGRLKSEADALRKKQKAPWAQVLELMDEDERFQAFLNQFPGAQLQELGEYLAQLESEASAATAPNYYKLEYAKLKSENAGLVDSSNEMAGAVGLLQTQIGSLEEQIGSLRIQLADSEQARERQAQQAAQNDELLRNQLLEARQLLQQRDGELKEERRAALDLQQRLAQTAQDIACNRPFYDKIARTLPNSSLLGCIQRPESMIDDMAKAFDCFKQRAQNSVEKATETAPSTLSSSGKRDAATAISQELLNAQFLTEQHFARWLCLQTIATVQNFAQQRLQFRELARRQDERLRLLGNTLGTIRELLGEHFSEFGGPHQVDVQKIA